MAMDALVKPLLLLPLFQGLKPLQLTEIVRRAGRVIYRPGDVIIEEDQLGEAAIIIVSGEAVRTTGIEPGDAAEPIAEGSMIGELAMLVETVHSATIVARGTVKALRLTRSEMHDLMAEDPGLADHLTHKITSRLQSLAQELRDVDRALADIAAYEPALHAAVPDLAAAPLH